mgnify:CR=1 FL=1
MALWAACCRHLCVVSDQVEACGDRADWIGQATDTRREAQAATLATSARQGRDSDCEPPCATFSYSPTAFLTRTLRRAPPTVPTAHPSSAPSVLTRPAVPTPTPTPAPFVPTKRRPRSRQLSQEYIFSDDEDQSPVDGPSSTNASSSTPARPTSSPQTTVSSPYTSPPSAVLKNLNDGRPTTFPVLPCAPDPVRPSDFLADPRPFSSQDERSPTRKSSSTTKSGQPPAAQVALRLLVVVVLDRLVAAFYRTFISAFLPASREKTYKSSWSDYISPLPSLPPAAALQLSTLPPPNPPSSLSHLLNPTLPKPTPSPRPAPLYLRASTPLTPFEPLTRRPRPPPPDFSDTSSERRINAPWRTDARCEARAKARATRSTC